MSLPANLLKGESPFLTVLWVSGPQTIFIFKARHLGSLSLWCRSLRSMCWTWGMNPLLLREKLPICEFPPNCGLMVTGHLCLFSPSSHILLPFTVEELFSFLIFFKGDCSICRCRFGASLRGGEFSIFLQNQS